MNPSQKKKREAVLAQRIVNTSKTKKHVARPVQSGKRISISHLLRKQ